MRHANSTDHPILEVTHLSKAFGGVQAVDRVSLTVRAGQMVALIGPNGAGKSTTFNLINGQLQADSGHVCLSGESLLGLDSRQIWQRGVGRTFQMASVFQSLTVLENILVAINASAHRSHRVWGTVDALAESKAMSFLEQVGLADQAHRACHALAYADVKRLELAMVLVHQPKLLLMDEPTAGVDAASRHVLMQIVKRLVQQLNLAVLFTEHSMDVVFGYSDRVIAMSQGQIIVEDEPERVRQHPTVQQVYFGGAALHRVQTVQMPSPAMAPAICLDAMVSGNKPALSLKNICAGYGGARVLHDVTLDVMAGEVVGLMGHNGAGKSTTLKTTMGLITQQSGRIQLFGQDISTWAVHDRARLGLGFVPEDRRIFTDLTVLENLQMGVKPSVDHAHQDSSQAWTVDALFALFPNLAGMPHRLGSHMSGGEQQMLSIARTLMGNPRVLLLDEPSEGVAPIIVEQLIDALQSIKKRGLSVLLCEQNASFAQAVCDRFYTIQDGGLSSVT